MILTSRVCRDAGFCIDGQRKFCKTHGIDFRNFVKHGIAFDELAGIEDANLERAKSLAIKRTQERAENGR